MENDRMAESTRRLCAAMLTNFGEAFRRKWQGFTPRELGLLWSQRFSKERIHPSVIDRLCDEIEWLHPPNLTEIVEALTTLQGVMKREHDERSLALRLPAPSIVAAPDSEAVKAFRNEFRRFASKHFVSQ